MELNPSGDYPEIVSAFYGHTTGGYVGDSIVKTFEAPHWRTMTDFRSAQLQPQSTIIPEPNMPTQSRRIVQVFIADTNENVPLEKSVLYSGEQKLTDLNDQELFFELPIAEKLKEHNEARVKYLDKESSKRAGKDVFLDAAKIRDLKMLVVTIAQF